MKTKLPFAALVVLTASFAACGGGGGTNGGPPPPPITPTPAVSTTPTTAPTPNFACVGQPFAVSRRPESVSRMTSTSPRPLASGDTFTFTGSLQQTIAQSEPCPEPTATSSAAISQTVIDAATTAPDGNPGVDSRSSESDVFNTSGEVQTTTDSILQEKNQEELLYSTSSTDWNGNTLATDYGSGNPQIIDKFPEGSGSWSNARTSTVSESLADGTSVSRNVASNGSYTETESFVDGGSAAISVPDNSGGGTYTITGAQLGGTVIFQYAPPSNGSIVLTITNKGSGVSSSKTRSFPAWFSVPLTLSSDQFADNGTVTIPAACQVPSAVTTSTTADQIVETLKVTDPVLGYIETRTTDWYDLAGLGPVCIQIGDTLDEYYDYSGDTTRIDYQSTDGNPARIETTTETLTLSQTPTVYSIGRRPQSVRALSPSYIASRVSAIDVMRAIERAQAIERFVKSVVRRAHPGGVR